MPARISAIASSSDDPGLHGVDPRGMPGEVDEEHAPSERIVEGPSQSDADGTIDNRSAKNLTPPFSMTSGGGARASNFVLGHQHHR